MPDSKKVKTEKTLRFLEAVAEIQAREGLTDKDISLNIWTNDQLIYRIKSSLQKVSDGVIEALEEKYKANPDYIRKGMLPIIKATSFKEENSHTDINMQGAPVINPGARNKRKTGSSSKVYDLAQDYDKDNARRVPLEEMEQTFRNFPFIPVKARATFAEFYDDDNYMAKTRTHPAPNVPDTKEFEHSLIIEIDGDSMEPILRHGMRVLVTPIQQSDWIYTSGGFYAVIFGTRFVVKRINNNTLLTKGTLELISDNPLGGNMTVKGEDIRMIWKVRQIVFAQLDNV